MSIFSKIFAALGGAAPHAAVDEPASGPSSSDTAPQYRQSLPTVRFDPSIVTQAVKDDLRTNLSEIPDFAEANFDEIYSAALQSVSAGRDIVTLFNVIMGMKLPGMTKQRAAEISRNLNNKATALICRDRQLSLGITTAIWRHAGAPCISPNMPDRKALRQDAAHRAANGQEYQVAKGMYLNQRWTYPGYGDGCKCISRSVLPGA